MIQPKISNTKVIRLNTENTKLLEEMMGEYGDANTIISVLFAAHRTMTLRVTRDNIEAYMDAGTSCDEETAYVGHQLDEINKELGMI